MVYTELLLRQSLMVHANKKSDILFFTFNVFKKKVDAKYISGRLTFTK